jgi:hypothetical protein
LSFVNDDTTDIGATGANRPKDVYISGDLNAEAGSVVANVDVTSGGDVSAGDDVLATDDVADEYANVRQIKPHVAADVPAEPFACTVSTLGWEISVDDTNDGGQMWRCTCLGLDDVINYAWVKDDDLGTCFP